MSGKVAAAVMSEPFVTQAEENYGAVPVADLNSGATEQFPMEGYATTASWARANPRTMKAFLIALEAGQQIADTDRQAVESAFVGLPQGAGHIDRVTAAVMALNVYPLGVDAVRLQRVADVMRQFGFLKRRFDIRAAARLTGSRRQHARTAGGRPNSLPTGVLAAARRPRSAMHRRARPARPRRTSSRSRSACRACGPRAPSRTGPCGKRSREPARAAARATAR